MQINCVAMRSHLNFVLGFLKYKWVKNGRKEIKSTDKITLFIIIESRYLHFVPTGQNLLKETLRKGKYWHNQLRKSFW